MMLHINCILPNYYNDKWLIPNVANLHRKRSGRHQLTFSVIDQRDTGVSESESLRSRLEVLLTGSDAALEFWSVINPEKRGGQSLPRVLAAGMYRDVRGGVQAVDSDISITIDTDALVYPVHWDAMLVDLYADEEVKVAGINPRGDQGTDPRGRDGFKGVVEWNFMSFRTAFWHDRIRSFRSYGLDIGHRFTHAVMTTPGTRQILFPRLYKPYADKAATVCGLNGREFVLHAFYASRKRKDKLPDSERSAVLSPDQENELIETVTGAGVRNPS